MRLLLINAVNPESEIEQRYKPLGLLYLSASLKQTFPPGTFTIRLVSDRIREAIRKFRPELIGITSVSQNYNIAKHYAALARNMSVPVIVGGVHISILPKSLSPDMDVGCLGEGEKTIVELVRVFLEGGGSFPCDKLERIPGLVYWKEGILQRTPPAEPILDLDSLPHPDRSLEGPSDHKYIFSSRGCPYRCCFCSSTRYWNTLRFFSPEYILEEIEELVNDYGARLISFYDDLFIANRKRLRLIGDLVEQREFNPRVKFTCSCRANTVNEDVTAQLKRLGVVSVGMGLESGNARILKYLKGSKITPEDNRRAVELLRAEGIRANASFVIGSPDETKEEMLETYRFIRENRLSFVDVYVLTPFPGTKVWDYALSRGLVSEDMDWDRLNVNFEINHRKAVILSELYTSDELHRIYRKFRRLRLLRNLWSLPNHPMRLDLPKVAAGLVKEKLLRHMPGLNRKK